MSITSGLLAYLKAYSALETGKPVWVDHLGGDPTQYAIKSLPGNKIVESYIDGSSLREFPFSFEAMQSTAADAVRLDNLNFLETFSDWLEAQTEAGTLPTLGAKQTAESIEAVTWGFLFDEGKSDTGTYQVICKLTYIQRP